MHKIDCVWAGRVRLAYAGVYRGLEDEGIYRYIAACWVIWQIHVVMQGNLFGGDVRSVGEGGCVIRIIGDHARSIIWYIGWHTRLGDTETPMEGT